MAVDIPAIREIVERVCTRPDVLDACKRRDLGFVIRALCAHGVTQDQIAALTGKSQGRLSEYMTHKRTPTATSTFEKFADGLGMPAAARRALGLDPEAAGSGPSDQAGGRSADIASASSGDVQPLLSNLSRASARPGAIGASQDPSWLYRSGPADGVHLHYRSHKPTDARYREGLRGDQRGGPGRDAPVCLPVHGVRWLDFPGRRRSGMLRCTGQTGRSITLWSSGISVLSPIRSCARQ